MKVAILWRNLMWCFKGDWYIGDPNDNCINTCKSHSLECTEKHLHERNIDVDSSSELLHMIKKLNVTITATSCSDSYEKYSDEPVFSVSDPGNHFCLFTLPKNESEFNCSTVPGVSAQMKQRLCWCHATGNINNVS